MRDYWYKEAIIYCLDVDTFMDSNGDGIGDFKGLMRRLDYIAGLGATCLWLLPFYPSPNRDNGYDVMDYYSVDGNLGTLGDFVEFMHRARAHGLRVIIDLVVNHTSDQHPWFQSARTDPHSPYREYYLWSTTEPPDADDGIVFPGVQETTWTYDVVAGAYYYHRFYAHQPDLNISHPAVREEIRKVMGFWLQLGVDGFRVDAAPMLIELPEVEQTKDIDPYTYLSEFRDFLSWRRGDAIMLAEANVEKDTLPKYFGTGDRMHMLFHFLLNQHLFLALARQQAAPLMESLQKLPAIPASGQWATFLRNHDELNLNWLSQQERQEVFEVFAPNPQMQLYGRGIRRRLAPIFDGDQRRLRMAYSLLLTLPGTPVLFYGEEIGMGDDLSLNERNSVRTPMQWSDAPQGGFSSAPRQAQIRPVISSGPYRYERVNMLGQRRDPDSLLNWMERAIRTRKECPEFGFGTWRILDTGDPVVFAHSCQWQGGAVLAVHNFADRPRSIALDLSDYDTTHLVELLGDRQHIPINGNASHISLDGYEYRWFRLREMPA
jgi:maltose alpha-D-glucosyltransferase / alpha-amylase